MNSEIRGRDLELAVLYAGGATLQEIGDAVGLTRERVRQRIKRIGMDKQAIRGDGWRNVRLENIPKQHRYRLGVPNRSLAQKRVQRDTWRWRLIVWLIRDWFTEHNVSPRAADIAKLIGVSHDPISVASPTLAHYLWCRTTKVEKGVLQEAWALAGVPRRKPGYRGHNAQQAL